MARFYYTLKTSETETPITDRGYYSLKDARKRALEYVRWTNYTDSVIIERNFRNYLFIDDSGTASYMKGEFIADGSPVMTLNKDGSIRATYGKKTVKRVKKPTKKVMHPFGL